MKITLIDDSADDGDKNSEALYIDGKLAHEGFHELDVWDAIKAIGAAVGVEVERVAIPFMTLPNLPGNNGRSSFPQNLVDIPDQQAHDWA